MRARRLKNEINVVPYIDVMLVLLVIFMVTAPMMQTGTVDLPSAGAANAPPENPLRVEVEKDGGFRISGPEGSRPVSREELIEALKAKREENPNLAILVAGDKSANYGAVLQALDEIRSLNFQRVGLETLRP
jgi:biopolymer transport protein TolR